MRLLPHPATGVPTIAFPPCCPVLTTLPALTWLPLTYQPTPIICFPTRYRSKMMSIAYNLRTSATLRGKVLSGALTPEALCQLSSEQLAEGTAIGTARQKAKTKAAAQITLKSEDLEVVVEQKEGGTKMVRKSRSPPVPAVLLLLRCL